ncbi:hypothetical protein ACT2CV_03540 [Pasteurellaceae bacterium 22721_9_1]
MKLLNIVIFTASFSMLAACSSSYSSTADESLKPYSVYGSATKRINTTQCKDVDDWYLDGYRVGKSFNQQKQQQLEQRVHFCKTTVAQLSAELKKSWDQGFAIGYKESSHPQVTKNTRKQKGKKRKK